MKLRFWMLTAALTLISAATVLAAATPLDSYLALRSKERACSLSSIPTDANPQDYKGRLVEIRGCMSGCARNGDRVLAIIEAGTNSYIVSCKAVPDQSPGAKVCALARVGEKSVTSMSDLQLVAMVYETEMVERERRIAASDAAKKKAREDAERQRQASIQARARSVENPLASRGMPVTSVRELVNAYKQAIRGFNSKLTDAQADTIAKSILAFSSKYQVDPRLVVAVILAESHFRPDARSSKGAVGLGQLMPGTAAGLGVYNAYDPVANVEGSVKLISGHLDKLSGNAPWTELTWNDLALALASYNAGAGAVKKYGGIPPYKETQNYVKKVCTIYKQLCGQK